MNFNLQNDKSIDCHAQINFLSCFLLMLIFTKKKFNRNENFRIKQIKTKINIKHLKEYVNYKNEVQTSDVPDPDPDFIFSNKDPAEPGSG